MSSLDFGNGVDREWHHGRRHERHWLGGVESFSDTRESDDSLDEVPEVLVGGNGALEAERVSNGAGHLGKVGELEVSPGQVAQEERLVAEEGGELVDLVGNRASSFDGLADVLLVVSWGEEDLEERLSNVSQNSFDLSHSSLVLEGLAEKVGLSGLVDEVDRDGT